MGAVARRRKTSVRVAMVVCARLIGAYLLKVVLPVVVTAKPCAHACLTSACAPVGPSRPNSSAGSVQGQWHSRIALRTRSDERPANQVVRLRVGPATQYAGLADQGRTSR